MQTLTCAQTKAKYKTLQMYYASTMLTALQTKTLKAFLHSVTLNNAHHADDTANLCSLLQSVSNVTQLNAQQYDMLLTQHNTVFREEICALLRKTHKQLYKKIFTNLNVCLLDLY